MTKDRLVELSFQLIANAGQSKTLFLEAIDLAEKNKISEANKKIQEGRKFLADTHKIHYEVIVEESKGKDVALSVLFMHAEDQFLSAETTGNLAEKFINLYLKMYNNK